MITLTQTTQILEVVTTTTAALGISVAFADITTSGATLGDQQTLVSSATTTTILAAPEGSTQRQVKFINIFNTSGSTNVVKVSKDISGTNYDLMKVQLASQECLQYIDGQGWCVFANTGALKTSLNQGSSTVTVGTSTVVLASNVTNNNAVANTIQDVTGLSFPVTNGKTYRFKFTILYSANATTTGSRWAINGPAFTRLNYISEYSLTTSTTTRNAQQTAYDLPAASNATSATTGSNMAIIEGVIVPAADGNVIARFASEVSANAIVALAGSLVVYQQLD